MTPSSPSTNENLTDFRNHSQSAVGRVSGILAAVSAATILGGAAVGFVQLMNPQLQPGYRLSEIGDHDGHCRHFIHRTPGTSIYVPQPPDRNMVQIAEADAVALLGKKPATGQEIWNQCRVYGPSKTTYSHRYTPAKFTP